MKDKYKILAINPGSTTTKISVYNETEEVFTEVINHSRDELKKFKRIFDQFDFRKEAVLNTLEKKKVDLKTLDAIVGRGGNMKPVVGGTYHINEPMLKDLEIGIMGQHACNSSAYIAHSIATPLEIPSFVVDPVVVDELGDLARISGFDGIPRRAKDHPLNQRAVCRRAAKKLGGKYEEFNFVIAHMGGGISIGVHNKGRIIDVNNCLDGDGPFTPERTGSLPFGAVIDLCFSGKYTKEELYYRFVGGGGLVSYLGTNDGREVKKMIEAGNEKAKLVYEAMAYQVSKEIGAGATVLKGDVDAILLTGGLANDELFVGWIKKRVKYIGDILVYPGEYEMVAMAEGAIRVLRGQEEPKIYS